MSDIRHSPLSDSERRIRSVARILTLIEGDRRMIGFHRVVHMPRGLVRKTCLTCKTRWPCPHHVLSLAVTETTWLEEDPLWMDPLWPDPFDLEGDDPR